MGLIPYQSIIDIIDIPMILYDIIYLYNIPIIYKDQGGNKYAASLWRLRYVFLLYALMRPA